MSTLRKSIFIATGIAALFGPAVARAHCIDFDGNKVCADHDHGSDVPPVTGKPVVDTSTGTYRPEPSPPPSEPKEKEPQPSKPSEHEHKFVKH